MGKKMTNSQIKDIQRAILLVYKEFAEVCKENNLRYFAIGGTAIGAVRHEGFIPWDDDLDVAMPRRDYEKFCEIAKYKFQNGRFRFIDHLDNTKTSLFFGKLSDETTTDVEKLNKKNPDSWNGVFIDIFPLDGVPSNKFIYKLHTAKLRFIYYAVWSKVYTPGKKDSTFVKALLKRLMRLATFYTNIESLKRKSVKIASKYDFYDDSVEFLARTWLFTSHHGMQSTARYKKEDFAEAIPMPFESTTILLPKGYDNYLSSLYPNYMTLPPKDMRKPSHSDGLLDLNHSYKYYIAKRNGLKIGYTAGCYDLFHIGHINLLRRAKSECDYLIVGVNSDEAMFSYKEKYPIIPQDERMEIIRTLRCVDEVVLVTNPDKMKAYKLHKYDVIFVGDDHKTESKWIKLEKSLAKKGSRVRYFEYTKHISSTGLRKKIKTE